MNIKKFLTDDSGVSPVIGVILMVAITVILAAVIGAFVIGIGDDQETVPQASWDISQDVTMEGIAGEPEPVTIDIEHTSGDSISASNIDITAGGETIVDENSDAGEGDWAYETDTSKFEDTITAGNQATIQSGNGDDIDTDEAKGENIRIVWESDSGGDSSILSTYTVN